VSRLPRSVFPDGTYHACTRGVDGTPVFRDDHDRRYFVSLLAEVSNRTAWVVHAFCLMTTHYHVVLAATVRNLSEGFRQLNGTYAQRFNERYLRTGHLFGDRFWSGLIEDEEELTTTCTYVLDNPVRAGLCADPHEWAWSGSRRQRAAWRILG
jgi:putative transposase